MAAGCYPSATYFILILFHNTDPSSLVPISWHYFNVSLYTMSGARFLYGDKTEHVGQAKPYSKENMLLLSRKAAPLKIPFCRYMHSNRQKKHIPSFEAAIDYESDCFPDD